MIKIKTLICLSLLFLVWGCGTMSDAGKVLRNEKTNSTDEFLVKKKAPLTLPPDFAEIPAPGALEEKKKEENEKNKIERAFRIDKAKSNKKIKAGSIEESILKRIGK
jgi:hypothetical protein